MLNKVVSSGVFGTSSLPNMEILTTLEGFMAMAYTIAYYWVVVGLLLLSSVRDFCEIVIFTTFKITERVIWLLEVAGFVQIHEKNGLVHIRGISTQTDVSVNKETEQPVSIMTVNDVKFPSSVNKFNYTDSLCQSSDYELQLTCPQRNIVATRNLNALEEINEPPLLILNDNKASPNVSSQLQHTSQSPVCRIHLTPCPTNLRAKYAKVIVGELSPEERSSLKRKWNSWSFKNSKKNPCLRIQPLFSSNPEENSSEEKRQKKVRAMGDYEGGGNQTKQSVLVEESPEISGCYRNVMLKLKSKFMRRGNAFATYKNF